MKSFLILLLGLLFPYVLFSQGNTSSARLNNASDLPVIIDPIIQSYDLIVNLPSAKVDKEKYTLGFGDVITLITKGTYPLVLKSHVITSSEEIYIPKVGFVQVGGKTILEAEAEFQKVLSEQFGAIRAELSLELAKQVNASIYFPNGEMIEGRYAATKTFFSLINQAIKTKEMGTDDALKTVRPQTPADNPLLKSALVSTPFADKNIDEQFQQDVPSYRVFDYRNYPFDFRSVSISYVESEPIDIDLFSDWLAGDLGNPARLNANAEIYLKPRKRAQTALSVSGEIKKSFVIPVYEDDNVKEWIEPLLISSEVEYIITVDDQDYSYDQLSDAVDQIQGQIKLGQSLVKLHIKETQTTAARRQEGFWFYDSAINQFEFIQSTNLIDFFANRSIEEQSYTLIRNDDWQNERARLERLLLEEKNPLMEDQLDYLQYLRENDAVIPISASSVDESFTVPDGYILVSFAKTHTIKLMGQFVQPGQYQVKGADLAEYVKASGGLTSAATGEIYVIKSGNFAWMDPADTTIEPGDILYAERIPVDNFQAYRTFKIQKENLKRDRIRTYISAVGTILSVLTTIIVISRN